MSGDVKGLLDDARRLAESARQFDPVAGAMFGGNKSTAQHKALADAVDRLAAVCEALADGLAAKDAAVRVFPPRFGTDEGAGGG
jgi:hypothetical protein